MGAPFEPNQDALPLRGHHGAANARSDTRKNILVFIDWYLPGYRAGGPIQSVASMVSRLPYNFWIVTSSHDHQSTEPYAGIPTGKWIRRLPNENVMYLPPGGMTTQVLRHVLRSERFDHVYINSIFSRCFAIRPLRYLSQSGFADKIVVAPRGMLKAGALSVKSLRKKVFLQLARIARLFHGVTWHATNAAEADEIRRHFPAASKIYVAPNLPRSVDAAPAPHAKRSGELSMVAVARISKEKNIASGIRYLGGLSPYVKASWDLFGPEQDPAYLAACKTEAGRVKAKVAFKGSVPPDEIAAILPRYDFFYLPTLGENYGHAIAEALLAGLPVIVSDKTPWQCVETLQAGWALPLRVDAFAAVLQRCAEMGPEEYQEYRGNAWRLGQRIANDPTVLDAYRQLFG
jgi:glycosyltransferase involved in cell wall biosynthesis